MVGCGDGEPQKISALILINPKAIIGDNEVWITVIVKIFQCNVLETLPTDRFQVWVGGKRTIVRSRDVIMGAVAIIAQYAKATGIGAQHQICITIAIKIAECNNCKWRRSDAIEGTADPMGKRAGIIAISRQSTGGEVIGGAREHHIEITITIKIREGRL